METKDQLPKTAIYNRIETFIKRYYALDLEIDRDAFKIPCKIDNWQVTLGSFLTNSLNNYLIAKHNYSFLKDDKNRKDLEKVSTHLLMAITQLYGARLIKESKSLLSKLEEFEEENKQLKETICQLRAEIANLRMQNKRLHNLVGDQNRDNTSTLQPSE
jgi:cell division protein FtsB